MGAAGVAWGMKCCHCRVKDMYWAVDGGDIINVDIKLVGQ